MQAVRQAAMRRIRRYSREASLHCAGCFRHKITWMLFRKGSLLQDRVGGFFWCGSKSKVQGKALGIAQVAKRNKGVIQTQRSKGKSDSYAVADETRSQLVGTVADLIARPKGDGRDRFKFHA